MEHIGNLPCFNAILSTNESNNDSMTQSKKQALAVKSDGNPEGKGANGFLLDWSRTEPRGVVAKPGRQILTEFFTTMLVLSAQFKYRPSVGTENFLYWSDDQWSLSLIGPDEWSADKRGSYVGCCVLQSDMTWTIRPSELLAEDNDVAYAVARFYEAFADTLDSDLTLEEILPFYVHGVGYYQRLFASAMSRSVRAAVSLGEQTETPCQQWRALLPQLKNVLPAPPASHQQ